MAECIHLLEESQCTLCNGRDRQERQRADHESSTIDYTFSAKFVGACQRCGDTFDSGEKIARMLDGTIICMGCAS